MLFSGSCSCGHTDITGSAPPLSTTICHCSSCRTSSSPTVPSLAFSSFPASSLSLSPVPTIVSTSSIASRTYCPTCGDLLAMNYRGEPDRVHLVASKIDRGGWRDGVEPEGLKPHQHIFVGEKDPEVPLPEDGLPRFEAFSDVWQEAATSAASRE